MDRGSSRQYGVDSRQYTDDCDYDCDHSDYYFIFVLILIISFDLLLRSALSVLHIYLSTLVVSTLLLTEANFARISVGPFTRLRLREPREVLLCAESRPD